MHSFQKLLTTVKQYIILLSKHSKIFTLDVDLVVDRVAPPLVLHEAAVVALAIGGNRVQVKVLVAGQGSMKNGRIIFEGTSCKMKVFKLGTVK